jgi:hypothetical protein
LLKCGGHSTALGIQSLSPTPYPPRKPVTEAFFRLAVFRFQSLGRVIEDVTG